METAKRLEAARRALARAEESVGLSSAPSGARAPAGEWSVPDALSWLFPRGLSRGMTVGVRGSRLAALLVAGIASGAGAWSVFLGCAGTGWAVAASLGVDLDRTVCVPRVGEAVRSQVLAAAVDGFDVAVIGSSVRLLRYGKPCSQQLIGKGSDLRRSFFPVNDTRLEYCAHTELQHFFDM